MQKIIQFHFFTKILVSWFFPLLTGFYSCYLSNIPNVSLSKIHATLPSKCSFLLVRRKQCSYPSRLLPSLSTLPLHFLPSCSLWPATLLSPAHCPDYQCRHLSFLDSPAKHKSLSLPCDLWFMWAPLPLLSQWDSHSSCACRCLYSPVHRPTCLRHSSCYSLSIFLFAKKISHNISCQGWYIIYTGQTHKIPCRIGHMVDY